MRAQREFYFLKAAGVRVVFVYYVCIYDAELGYSDCCANPHEPGAVKTMRRDYNNIIYNII